MPLFVGFSLSTAIMDVGEESQALLLGWPGAALGERAGCARNRRFLVRWSDEAAAHEKGTNQDSLC